VEGVYSDLLLHEYGPSSANNGGYGIVASTDEEELDEPLLPLANGGVALEETATTRDFIGASAKSGDSTLCGRPRLGPYLHDGRADTAGGSDRPSQGRSSRNSAEVPGPPRRRARAIARLLKSLAPRVHEGRLPPPGRGDLSGRIPIHTTAPYNSARLFLARALFPGGPLPNAQSPSAAWREGQFRAESIKRGFTSSRRCGPRRKQLLPFIEAKPSSKRQEPFDFLYGAPSSCRVDPMRP